MKCAFCEHDLTPDMLLDESCGACIGGCRKIHCPYCGHENPVVSEFLDKLLKRGKDKGAGKG